MKTATLLSVLLLLACSESKNDAPTKTTNEKVTKSFNLPAPNELISAEDVRSAFQLHDSIKISENIDDYSLDCNLSYSFQEPSFNASGTNSIIKRTVNIGYIKPGKATYKTSDEAIAFMEKKIKEEPESYTKLDNFPAFAVRDHLADIRFLVENTFIDISVPHYKKTEREIDSLARYFATKAYDRIQKMTAN